MAQVSNHGLSATALTSVDTLTCDVPKATVSGSKTIPGRYRTALAAFLKKLVTDGRTQRQLGEAMGVSQSHIAQLMKGEDGSKGIGLPALIRLHENTEASIDEMLGIKASSVEERLSRLEREVSAKKDTPPPSTGVRRRRR